jgi:hypothetical protein
MRIMDMAECTIPRETAVSKQIWLACCFHGN